MARLSEQLGDFLSRVELLARGAEWQRQEAAQALAQNRPGDARQHALAILDELPHSRVALALWADAAEAMLLDHEAVEALSKLADAVPFRADVWLRLAQARLRQGDDPGGALERAAEAVEPVGAADSARLWLADLDLARRDFERAERWLEQLSLGARSSPDALLRRVEVALDSGDVVRAGRLAERLPAPETLDARAWLVRGRLLAEIEPERAAHALERALLLEAPQAGRVVAEIVGRARDRKLVERLARAIGELGHADHPLWRTAFALADGRISEALRTSAEAARSHPEPELLRQLVALALDARDAAALAEAIELARGKLTLDPGLLALGRALAEPEPRARLDALDAASGPALGWAEALRRELFGSWLPTEGAAAWPELLAEIGRSARGLGALDAVARAESIAKDLERPLRVAVVGEFNAGKSSFINALLGQAVAPMGVLPTTATLNRLVWAPDPFVRIERRDADDRLVPHGDLSRALSDVDAASVESVTIYAPLEPLRRLEIVDTPGFNAPEREHARTARAAFDDAHVALWLLDASQPLKQSEREVIAELGALGLPLVVLLNKLDRLGSSEALADVVAHVESGLEQAGVTPVAAPLAFSARLALQGRAGDAEALERSRWAEVEALVEHVLVEGSAELRERTLRRRAARVVAQLSEAATEQASARRAQIDELARRADGLRSAASRVRTERARFAREMVVALDQLLDRVTLDLRPVAGGADSAARRFASSRVRAAAGRELPARAAALASEDPDVRAALIGVLSPRIQAMCGAVGPWLVLGADAAARASAREELAAQVVDELALAADQAAAISLPAVSSPEQIRTRDLLTVLSR